MRTIKFRGQRDDTKEWAYGYYWYDSMRNVHMIQNIEFHSSGWNSLVLVETVGQFTGLYDKNGKEIYEGDIVNCWGGEWVFGVWEYLEIIEILDIREMFELTNVNWEGIEIIGNIHDNKEIK